VQTLKPNLSNMTLTENAMPLITRLIAANLKVADKSAACVQRIFQNGNLKIEDKGGLKNYQTEADTKIEQLLRGNIEKHFPDITVIGEEGEVGKIELEEDWIDYDKALTSFTQEFIDCKNNESMDLSKVPADIDPKDLVIWLDPLDGTAEFIDGLLSHVTTLIGIAHKGKPIAGIINQPFFKNENGSMGRSIWGIVGVGAFGFRRQEQKPGRILTTSRSHITPMVQECLDAISPTEILKMGGAGNKVLQLIENNAHAYLFASRYTKKWDTCAPEAVLLALGGKLTDVHGSSLEYHADVQQENKAGVVAAVENIDFYLGSIPQSIKDKLPP